MKKLPILVLWLAALFIISCDSEPFESGDIKPMKAKEMKGKLQNKVLISEALADNVIGNTNVRKMQIYTPPGYDKHSDINYPVVYLLHGLPFSEKSYTDLKTWDEWIDPNGVFQVYPDFPEEGFRKWMDNMILDGRIDPMIIVMPNAESEQYGFSFYTNSILNGNFEDYIVQDVVKYMDDNYNTIQNASGRAVIGNSQGGYAAFKFGMKHSDVFGVVASHSGLIVLDVALGLGPALVLENPDGFVGPDPGKFLTSAAYAMSAAWSPNLQEPPFYVDFPIEYPSGNVITEIAARWYQEDPFTLLDIYSNEFRSLKGIYFDCGMNDELNICAGNDFMKQKLDYHGIDYTYVLHGGGHFTNIFERLEASLAFSSEAMTQ
jgi:S-formylglutathione hydrolase FrmB